MTLLAQIQCWIERTYAAAGFRLEDCLIPRARSLQLAALAPGGAHLAGRACTFLRLHQGNLHIAIYYAPELIEVLEREDPRESISHRNIGALVDFLEEAAHGVHAALAFTEGWRRWDSEQFACAMEAQAKVDVYFLVLRLIALLGRPGDPEVRAWVGDRVFAGSSAADLPYSLRRRYRLAGETARGFTGRVERSPAGERRALVRAFRRAGLAGKMRLARG